MTHLIWHLIHLVSLILTNYFPIYEVCIFPSSSNSPNKYVPPPLPIKHPMIWSIFHAKLIWNINWYHPKTVHMNDNEKMRFHVHSLLLNFTVYFLLDRIPLFIVSYSLNNVHWIFVINNICKHILTCCVTLYNCHFYFSSHFVPFFLIFTSFWIISSGTSRPCVLVTKCNSLFYL